MKWSNKGSSIKGSILAKLSEIGSASKSSLTLPTDQKKGLLNDEESAMLDQDSDDNFTAVEMSSLA